MLSARAFRGEQGLLADRASLPHNMAGMIKIRGDSCWRDLTAMCYHYETQPVPNPVSWYEIPTTLPTEHSPFL